MRKPLFLLVLSGLALAEGPYTLDDCRRLAREKNADVRQAKMELEGAQETRKVAFTKYFPQVSGTLGALVAKDPLLDTKTPSMNLPVYNGDLATLSSASQYAYVPSIPLKTGRWADLASLTVVQPLFVGGRVVQSNRLAGLGEDVARSKMALAGRDAVAQAEEKYWTLLSLQEKRRTLDAYDTMLARLSVQAQDAVTHGLATRNDLLKVRLKQSEVRVNRLQLESGLRLAVRDLRQHLGLAEDTALPLADTLPMPQDPASLAGFRQEALGRRLETRLLAQSVRSEELQADIEKATMLPSVLVGVDASYLKVSEFDGSSSLTAFGVVSVPISDIWSGYHSTEGHRIKMRQAQLQEAETRRKIAMGVDKDWDDLLRAYQASLVAGDAVAQSDVNLAEENDRYRNGLATLSDLLEAQTLRQQAVEKRVEAWKDYWAKRCGYLRSVGRDGE
jgi:outer membrane protein TolC